MKSIGEFIKWFIYITIGIFLVCAISFTLEGATEMPVSTFWKILLESLVATVVTVLLQPKEDDGTGKTWIKFALHYLSLCIIMCCFGIWFGWIHFSVVGIFIMALDVAKISTYTIDKVEFKKPTNVSSTMQDEVAIAAVASKMNAGETSAPFEGVNGVYVIEVASKDAKNGTFDATAEKQQIESLYNRNYIVTAVEKALGKIYPMENRVYVHF